MGIFWELGGFVGMEEFLILYGFLRIIVQKKLSNWNHGTKINP